MPLKLPGPRPLLAEVIEQAALPVEDLHDAPLSVDDIEMRFGIEANPFGTEHPSCPVSDLADRIAERARPIEHLHAEIHGVDHHQVRAVQPQFGREIELALSRTCLSNALEHATLHIHHEDLVAERVGDVDVLCRGIHRDSGWTLEVSLATFQAADGVPEFAVRIE